jgi:hypothetical protein
MNNSTSSTPRRSLTPRQETIRRHAGERSLRGAVRLASFGFFRFTHCSSAGNALWSEAQQVWLGKATFLHWSMFDPEIELPRVVDIATNAPKAPDELHRVLRKELSAYWADQLSSLPSREHSGWLPLP